MFTGGDAQTWSSEVEYDNIKPEDRKYISGCNGDCGNRGTDYMDFGITNLILDNFEANVNTNLEVGIGKSSRVRIFGFGAGAKQGVFTSLHSYSAGYATDGTGVNLSNPFDQSNFVSGIYYTNKYARGPVEAGIEIGARRAMNGPPELYGMVMGSYGPLFGDATIAYDFSQTGLAGFQASDANLGFTLFSSSTSVSIDKARPLLKVLKYESLTDFEKMPKGAILNMDVDVSVKFRFGRAFKQWFGIRN